MGANGALLWVKLAHTFAWALLAACVLAIPVAAYSHELSLALMLAAVVALEVLVLASNAWRCPLTNVAARYTSERSDNFDIWLPAWLARHNKAIFGTLYAAGLAYSFFKAWRG